MILLENHTRISLAGYNTRQESNRKKVQSLLQKKSKQTERRRSTPHYSPPPPSHETDKKKTHTLTHQEQVKEIFLNTKTEKD